MGQDTAHELLLPILTSFLLAFLGAFLWIPLGHLTILEETRMTIAFHLIQFSTDLLQGTELRFKVEVIVSASFHLSFQILLQGAVFK